MQANSHYFAIIEQESILESYLYIWYYVSDFPSAKYAVLWPSIVPHALIKRVLFLLVYLAAHKQYEKEWTVHIGKTPQ